MERSGAASVRGRNGERVIRDVSGTKRDDDYNRDERRACTPSRYPPRHRRESKVLGVHLAADTFSLLLQSSRLQVKFHPSCRRKCCRTRRTHLYPLIEIATRETPAPAKPGPARIARREKSGVKMGAIFSDIFL